MGGCWRVVGPVRREILQIGTKAVAIQGPNRFLLPHMRKIDFSNPHFRQLPWLLPVQGVHPLPGSPHGLGMKCGLGNTLTHVYLSRISQSHFWGGVQSTVKCDTCGGARPRSEQHEVRSIVRVRATMACGAMHAVQVLVEQPIYRPWVRWAGHACGCNEHAMDVVNAGAWA